MGGGARFVKGIEEKYLSNVKHDTIDLTGDAKLMAIRLKGVEAQYVFFASFLAKRPRSVELGHEWYHV